MGCRDCRGAPQLTGVLAVADTMAAHARLTSELLAVNYHCEKVVWPVRAAGGTTARLLRSWCSFEKASRQEDAWRNGN